MTDYSSTIISDVMSDEIVVSDDMTFRSAAVWSSGFNSKITNTAELHIERGDGIISSGIDTNILNIGLIVADGIGITLQGLNSNLVNTGSILGQTIGVKMAGRSQVLDNIYSISSDDVGILTSGNHAIVHSDGNIYAPHIGILSTGDDATIVISGGISADGTIRSKGTGAIIAGDDAVFVNEANIAGAVGMIVSGRNDEIVNEYRIWGVSDERAVIKLHGSGTTILTNHGKISGQSDYIIEGGGGEEVIRNDGSLKGRVYLGGGADIFDTRGGGAGKVFGGDGDDTYYLGSPHNSFYEERGHGVDTAISAFGYTLPENFENLTLTGSDNIDGRGNDGANILTASRGDNHLYGDGGRDVFIFSAKGGSDVIGDFDDGADRIGFTQIPSKVGYDEIRDVMTEMDGNVVIDLSGYKWGFKLTIEHATLEQMDRSDFLL